MKSRAGSLSIARIEGVERIFESVSSAIAFNIPTKLSFPFVKSPNPATSPCVFKRDDIAVLTFDFLDFQEEEEIKWKIINDEILIDDSLNKKINLGSENNVWVLKNDMIFLKEKNRALNKAVFLKKVP